MLTLSVAYLLYSNYENQKESEMKFTNLEERLVLVQSELSSEIFSQGLSQIEIKQELEEKIDTKAKEQSSTLKETALSISHSIVTIKDNLTKTTNESREMANVFSASLSQEQQRISSLQAETEKINDTVDTLEKLSQVDPELLQKYSKVFFLNEHYVPAELSEIKNKYLYSEARTQFVHSGVINHLTQMLDHARKSNITLYVKSSYRSFNQQDHAKAAYVTQFGEDGANQFSADQGYSEHQLGTTVDLITTGLGGELDGFESTLAYPWLTVNAHKYGFILSYPRNNEFYVFEPWHWRFVGVELATKLHLENRRFYDLGQREIDEYIAKLFN